MWFVQCHPAGRWQSWGEWNLTPGFQGPQEWTLGIWSHPEKKRKGRGQRRGYLAFAQSQKGVTARLANGKIPICLSGGAGSLGSDARSVRFMPECRGLHDLRSSGLAWILWLMRSTDLCCSKIPWKGLIWTAWRRVRAEVESLVIVQFLSTANHRP